MRLDWLAHILLNYTRLENAHKVRKKTFVFLLCVEVRQTFSFPFSQLKHYQIPECFYVNNCCFELVQLFYHATEIGNVANADSACAEQPVIAWDIVNYRGPQILKMRSGRKVCKKVMRWFLDADNNAENLIVTICPIDNVH